MRPGAFAGLLGGVLATAAVQSVIRLDVVSDARRVERGGGQRIGKSVGAV